MNLPEFIAHVAEDAWAAFKTDSPGFIRSVVEHVTALEQRIVALEKALTHAPAVTFPDPQPVPGTATPPPIYTIPAPATPAGPADADAG